MARPGERSRSGAAQPVRRARLPGWSATRRSAIAGRSAARSRTATRRPTRRRRCSRSTPRSSRTGRAASGPSRPASSSRAVRDGPAAERGADGDPRAEARRRGPAGRTRSSTGGRSTGPSSGSRRVVERQNGNVGSARVALTNMDSKPVRAGGVESALAGAGADADALAAAASHAAEGTNPPSDTNGSAEYRTELVEGAGQAGAGGSDRRLKPRGRDTGGEPRRRRPCLRFGLRKKCIHGKTRDVSLVSGIELGAVQATKGVPMGSPVVHFEINSQNPGCAARLLPRALRLADPGRPRDRLRHGRHQGLRHQRRHRTRRAARTR